MARTRFVLVRALAASRPWSEVQLPSDSDHPWIDGRRPSDGLATVAFPYGAVLASHEAAAEPWTVDRVENKLGEDELDVARMEKIRDVLKRAHTEEN